MGRHAILMPDVTRKMVDPRAHAAQEQTALADKLAFLASPAAYLGATTRVDVRQTHLSWVFLTDRYVYKLKKPVADGTVDFQTAAARRGNSFAELQLNRRLAPSVYLGVVALTRGTDGKLALDGPGQPIDWLVKMARLDAGRFLDRLIRVGQIGAPSLQSLVETLVNFYRNARPAPEDPDSLLDRYQHRIADCQHELSHCSDALVQLTAGRVRAALFEYIAKFSTSLRCRAQALREVHGDLRPEHIHLGDPVAIIDCLEFDRTLRILDPAEELAYLAIECQRLDDRGLGQLILTSCCQQLGDPVPAHVIHFYRAFRALQRARLCFRRRAFPGAHSAHHWISLTCGYLAMATRYAAGLPSIKSDSEPS